MNVSKVQKKIYDVLKELDKTLMEDESLMINFSSKEQVVKFRLCFLNILKELSEGFIPPKVQRSLGVAKIVVDCWPFDFHLGQLLIEAERLYKDL